MGEMKKDALERPTDRASKAAVDMEIHAACRIQTIGMARALDEHFPGYDDMLAALRLVLDADQMAIDPEVGLRAFVEADKTAMQAVRAAIAKAEGRSLSSASGQEGGEA